MCGSFGQKRRSSRVAASVNRAMAAVAREISSACSTSELSTVPIRCSAGSVMPSSLGRLCRTISAAAPLVKPRRAAGEMKLASPPSRSAPISHCIAPTSSVTPSASWM